MTPPNLPHFPAIPSLRMTPHFPSFGTAHQRRGMATETEVRGLLKERQATGHSGVLTFEPRLHRLCMKGMDAMRRALCLLGSFCLLTTGCMTTRPVAPVADRTQYVVAADQEEQRLHARLSEL